MKGLHLCIPYPKPHPHEGCPCPGWKSGQNGSPQTGPCQKTASLGFCLPFPFTSPTSAGPRQENGANHLVHGCKINTHTFNGKMQFKVQWSTEPFSFLEDCSTWHLVSLPLIIETAGEGPCTAAWHIFFGRKILLVFKCCKAITQHNSKFSWPDVFPLFFRWRSPTAKETRCPSPSPGPSGGARRQVRAARGRAGSGAGAAWGPSGQSSLREAASDAPLFRAEVLCPQAKLNWRMFFMSKRDTGSHPLSVCWTTATTTTTTHLRAGQPQSTMCCTKASEELCHGITRRNKSIVTDLFNKPSATFWHWSAMWAELSWAPSKSPVNMSEGKCGHSVTPGLYTGGLRTQALCRWGASLVLQEGRKYSIDSINSICQAHTHPSDSVSFLSWGFAFGGGCGGFCAFFVFTSLCLMISLDLIYQWRVYQINLDCWCCGWMTCQNCI